MQDSSPEGGMRQSKGRCAQEGASGQDDGVLPDTERLEEVDCLRPRYFIMIVVLQRAVIRNTRTKRSKCRFPVSPFLCLFPPASRAHVFPPFQRGFVYDETLLASRKFPT